MSSKITKIEELSSQKNHPVILENFQTYLEHRQHDMKCLLANDRTLPRVGADVANMVLVTGEKEMYYSHIRMNSPESEQPDQLQTFVARRNRTTGKIRLVEVRSSNLMHISHDRPASDPTDNETDERRRLQLQRKFNAHWAYLQDKKKYNRVDLSMMEEKLQTIMAETVVKDVAESGLTKATAVNDELQQELHAKSNPNAETLANLYDAQRVIGPDEWHSLTKPAQKLLEIPVEYLSMANIYLENKVKAIMQSETPSTEPNLAVVRTCIYMDVLAQLTGPKAFRLTKKDTSVSSFTQVLDEPIRQNFLQRITAAGDRVTKYTRTKAMMYYLALVFALEGRQVVDLNTIQQSLQVKRIELINCASLVGARYNSKESNFTLKTFQPKSEEDRSNDLLEMLRGSSRGKRYSRN
uniref:DNA-directed RNA polymerase I subunit RPA49 n=1 Tax=Anopheles funestus TaxID=62324 RepID=A0A182R3W7_ANOFN